MRFELYRYTHPDGNAKEWAYSDPGTGQAEIRWGPANQLRQRRIKPRREAWDRALQKVRKGGGPSAELNFTPAPERSRTLGTCTSSPVAFRIATPVTMTEQVGCAPYFSGVRHDPKGTYP